VTFEDAERYCKFVEARLPTEAEFERAARGVEARRYPWGNLYNAYVANHGRFSLAPTDDRDGFEEAAPVGAFPQGRTPVGFLDLGGNVAEWVSDRYAIGYSEGDAIDPQGPTSPPAGSERVLRGGSYTSAGPWLRGAARISAEPATRRPFIGFRCARSAVRRPRAAE
jgi:formylglycine-generating enzyme required for sulfatase activity